jgi:GDP-4-dehydro-6-deoxy-D-mannose reductase
MRALVTGAGGFCGQHLLRYLHAQGVEVHTLGIKPGCGNHHHANPADGAAMSAAVAEARPDYVIHLAGVTHAQDLTLYYSVNTLYAATLLRALEIAGRQDCPILLTGTSAEYGLVTGEQLPITEETPARPYNHYGISKLAQTLMGSVLARHGRPLVMVRPFNIIGPGMPDYISVQSFARQIADIVKGRRPPVIEVGNLNSSRDFVDVDEAVKVYWRLVQTPAAYGEVFNVCSGRGVVVGDVLARLVALAGLPIEIRVDPTRFKAIDVPVHFGSLEKLQNILGYVTGKNLDASLKCILAELIKEP